MRTRPEAPKGVPSTTMCSCPYWGIIFFGGSPMNVAGQSILRLLGLTIYLALPVGIVWGWFRWTKRRQYRTRSSILCLISFTLATASALLAFSSLVYSHAIGGFPFYDPLLLRIYRWGGLLSFAAVTFAVGGVWRPSLLRRHASACSTGMLMFWFAAAIGE
jgi:hypothetical protein